MDLLNIRVPAVYPGLAESRVLWFLPNRRINNLRIFKSGYRSAAGLLLTSTRRWGELRFRIPESEPSARLALCRVSFQPGSGHIAGLPVERQEV